MSKQRTRKFVTKILRKTCSSLVKIISDVENNLTQNKYNKLQKISAKNYFFLQKRAKVQNLIWDLLYSTISWYRSDSNSKLIIKTIFLLYKMNVTI